MKQMLFDFVCRYFTCTGIPCQIIRPPFSDLRSYDRGLRSSVLGIPQTTPSTDLPQKPPAGTVVHLQDPFFCCYSLFLMPEAQDGPECFLAGPYLKTVITEDKLTLLLDSLGLPACLLPQLQEYYRSLACFPYNDSVQSCVNQLGRELFGPDSFSVLYHTLNSADSWEEYSNRHQLQNPEDPAFSMHLLEKRYEWENKLPEAIRRGDSQEAIRLAEDNTLFTIPKRLPDELRDLKNRLITLNTLLRKEAERGGVHPWHLDQLSGEIVLRIEKLRSAGDISIVYKIIRSYCNLVQKHSLSGYSLATRKILLQVDTDLNHDLSLSTLAAELKLNPSYLSSLFKQDMGISLTDYVNQRRIEFSKKLLRESSLPIQEIGEQAGFSDPRYFNRLFKRQSGMTPREYRTGFLNRQI